ncbi:MAG: Gfo/Idh/MocA family oxidoreductase [Planctomycetota bacterium]|nr:Gfo/Idh/MocA family oxidoreductase [Planctomycetota bacterium]
MRTGIIGLGVGEKHIAGYRRHAACEVVALCDFDAKKRAEARRKYPGLAVCANADEILDDPGIDAVSIASYDNYHHDQIVKALANNKHVFVEKPLCQSEGEAKGIRRLLRGKPRLVLSSNLILRMSPRFQWLRKAITQGKLGVPYFIEGDYNYGRLHKITAGWRGKLDFYSVVQGGAVHVIDLLMWLTNDRVVEVAAFGNRIASAHSRFKHDDMVVGILKFRSGMVGKVSANFGCVFPHFHTLSVYGTRGTFVNGLDHGQLFKSREPGVPPAKVALPYPGVEKGDLIYNFVETILGRAEPAVPVDDVFAAMSVCFALDKAAKSRRCVSVDCL